MALHHPATPGWAGLLHDWMRLLLGMRILHIATITAVLQQPVLASLVQQSLLLLGSDVGGLLPLPAAHRPLNPGADGAPGELAVHPAGRPAGAAAGRAVTRGDQWR